MFFHQQTFRWKKLQFFPCQSEALRATFGICRRDVDNITHSLNAEGVLVALVLALLTLPARRYTQVAKGDCLLNS